MPFVQHDSSMLAEAKRLARDGCSYREIGRFLGIHPQTAQRWADPGYNERFLPSGARRKQEWRDRGRFVPGTRVRWSTAKRMVAMRRDYDMSYAGIAGAVLTYEPGVYRKLSGPTVRKVLHLVAPDLPVKLHGRPFGSPRDPRLKAAA